MQLKEGIGVQELTLLKLLPSGTLDGGIELANRLGWNIAWNGSENEWYVWGGEKTLLKADSRASAEAFLYGLGLAYAVLPPGTVEQLAQQLGLYDDSDSQQVDTGG